MRRLLVVLCVAAWPASAWPCQCPIAAIKLVPDGNHGTVPLNAHVRIEVPAAGSADLAVVVKGGKAPIDAIREVYGTGDVRIIELTPKKKLAARTKYVVSVLAPGGKDSWVGEFTTGDAEDTTAPARPEVKAVEPDKKSARSDCATGDPYVILSVAPAGEPVRYAIWVGDAQGKIDYGAPPAALLAESNGKLLLGHMSQCLPANLEKWTKPPRFGVKAVDVAGNLSEAVEIGKP